MSNQPHKPIETNTESIDLALLLNLLNKCGTPLFVKNSQHETLFANDPMCDMVGIKKSEMIGKSDFELYSREEAEAFVAGDLQVFQSKNELAYEEVITDNDNNVKNIRTIKNLYETESGEELLVGTLHDITELRNTQNKLEDAINHLSVIAATDSLTGLANRTQFESIIERHIKQADESNVSFGVVFIDLNGFKVINDTAGHLVGDEILKICAKRLKKAVRSNTSIARVGGDEFLVLLPGVDEAGAARVVERIFQSLDSTINVNETTWQVGCSVGVAVYPTDGATVSELIRNADFAMYEAKKRKQNCGTGRSSVEFFRSRIGKSMARKRRIECALNFRENCSKIQQYYQPIVSRQVKNSHQIVGFESLARWELDGQAVPPDEFIPILEKSGAIIPFGYQVIESACRYVSDQCNEQQFVSVNLSYRQVVEKGFFDRVESTIRSAGINPQQIALELTEQDANLDNQVIFAVLSQISKIGVKTMLDDFGSGYSNLSRLSELPIDIVKLDKSLLWGDALLFNSVLQMIQNLGFKTIIEGVETAAQVKNIEQVGAEMLQGYFFGRPQPESYDWSNGNSDSPRAAGSLNLPSSIHDFTQTDLGPGVIQ